MCEKYHKLPAEVGDAELADVEDLMIGAKEVYEREHSAWQTRKAATFSESWLKRIKGKLGKT